MSHELKRLSELVYDTPMLADRKTLSFVVDYLSNRNSGDFLMGNVDKEDNPTGGVNLGEVGVAMMDISGPLTAKTSFMEALCGGGNLSSYESINAAMDDVVAHGGVHTLVVRYDTGGGMALNSFDCAKRLRSLADANDIKLISYIEGSCNSAGYVLACTAHEVVMNDDNSSSVGSIGALIALRNEIPKDMAEGTEVVFLSAGEDKIPFDKEGKFKKEFLEDLKASVDLLREDFISHVVEYRDLTDKQVRGTEAKSYQPDMALKLGLVDNKMGCEAFINSLADLGNNNKGMTHDKHSLKLKSIGDSEKMNEENTVQLDELKAQMAEMSAVLEKQQVSLEAVTAQRDGLAKLEEQRSAELLQGKLEGYSFASEGLMAVLGGLDKEGQEAILASLDSAEEKLGEAKEGKILAEEAKDSDMFLQASEEGEAELLEPAQALKASVSAIIKKAK